VRLVVAAVAAVALAAAPATKVDTGEAIYGLAVSGGSLWAGGLTQGDVLRVDTKSGKVIRRVNAGARIFNLAPAPGAVWAVSNLTNAVVRIDARTGKRTATVRVGFAPYDVAWGFGSVWVSNASGGTVSRIAGTHVVKTIRVGVEPNGLAAIGSSLWVTDHSAGKLLRIDPRANRIAGSVSLPGADWVTGFGSSLYVSQETNVVTRVDARTLKVLGRVKVPRNPLGSAIVGNKLFVPCIDGNAVAVVDPSTMKLVKTLHVGGGPIVVQPLDGHAWVSLSAGTAIRRL
jgi:virginiamycin B lyase